MRPLKPCPSGDEELTPIADNGREARMVAFIFPGPGPADEAEKYTPVTFNDMTT